MHFALRIKKLLRKTGFDLIRFDPNRYPVLRRKMIMDHHAIDHVLDVGANYGQYGMQLRNIGYQGKIDSFEPITKEFEKLSNRSRTDSLWTPHQMALGAEEMEAEINISDEYSQVSSLLPMLESAVERRAFWQHTSKETIQVKTLDSLFGTLTSGSGSIMLKIDTQGYEKSVLDGAAKSLPSLKLLQLEMSLVSLYENELLFNEMLDFLESQGFQLVSLEPGMQDEKTGQLFQVDGIFQRAADS